MSASFIYEGTKTIFIFWPSKTINSPRAPKRCFTNTSAAPLARALFLSVITDPSQPGIAVKSIRMECSPHFKAKFTPLNAASELSDIDEVVAVCFSKSECIVHFGISHFRHSPCTDVASITPCGPVIQFWDMPVTSDFRSYTL